MAHLIDISEMSQEQWLIERLKYLGASDIAVALNISKFKAPLELYKEKTKQPDFIPFRGNELTKWGKRAENIIAQGFAEDYGYEVVKDKYMRVHDNNILSCNLDRIIKPAPHKGRHTFGILEIKNMSVHAHYRMLKENSYIPVYYYPQIQQQFEIFNQFENCNWGFFAYLVGGNKLFAKPIYPDWEFIKVQSELASAWWNEHVINNTPPDNYSKPLGRNNYLKALWKSMNSMNRKEVMLSLFNTVPIPTKPDKKTKRKISQKKRDRFGWLVNEIETTSSMKELNEIMNINQDKIERFNGTSYEIFFEVLIKSKFEEFL